jgi:DNA recombination protein RmuC
VLTQAKRFEALDIETGDKEIPSLPVAEQAARPLAKLASAPAAVNDAGE